MERHRREYSAMEHGYDPNKEFVSKNGFKVMWHNAVEATTRQDGINIRLVRPDGIIKEDVFFPFGEEEAAQRKFDEYVALLKE